MATAMPVGHNPWERDGQRSSWHLGCIIPVSIASLLVVFAVVSLHQHSGGVASPESVRPLPEGAEVVVEQADCPGNGKGWHPCERRLRFRAAGASRVALGSAIADHYRSLGHVMERLDQGCTRQNCESVVSWGDPACRGREPSDDVCLFVQEPQYMSENGKEIEERPGDIDVVAESWTYFL